MTSLEFKTHVQTTLESLPSEVADNSLAADERKLRALVQLNTNIYPDLGNTTQTILEILRMKQGPEKLRIGMLWNIAVSQTSPDDMRAIVQLMDDFLATAGSSD